MPEFKICKVDGLAPGGMMPARLGAKNVVVFRDEGGNFSALEDCCSHARVKLSSGKFDGSAVECVAHGARFDVRTGRPLCMPAVSQVKRYDVKIVEGDVVVVVP